MEKAELRDIAQRIRDARLEAHLSQLELGKALGVSDKSISAYEMGRSNPSFEKLKRIAYETKRPMSYFTNETVDEALILTKLQSVESELGEIKKLLQKSRK